jgi:hypothetical protein
VGALSDRAKIWGMKRVVNVFGVVHPEAGGWRFDGPWVATGADGSTVQISLVDSVYQMCITTDGPDDVQAAMADGSLVTWLNEVIYGHQPLLHALLDALGLHLGAKLDPEMKSGNVEGVGFTGSLVMMAAFGTVKGPRPYVEGNVLAPTAAMAVLNPFVRSALADVRHALQFDEDCPFFCYRTLESLRKYYAATTDATSEPQSWAALGEDLAIDSADVSALKSFAATRRHGGAGTSLHADHLRWTQWTREVLVRFLHKHRGSLQQDDVRPVLDKNDPIDGSAQGEQ